MTDAARWPGSLLMLVVGLLLPVASPSTSAQSSATSAQSPAASANVLPIASTDASTHQAAPPAAATGEMLEIVRRLDAFLATLRPDALAAGVSPETYDRAIAGLTPDLTIPPLLVSQPEHIFAPWDYIGRLVSEARIETGRQKLAEHAAVLADVEIRHGVDRHVVVAIWGIESNYGTLPGARSVIRSLATLAVADLRRPAFWRKELLTALRILDRGDISPDRMTGSWAGAMGHTQFMPTSYMTHAVDHDGDGRRDIWTSVPDALASTAAYLKRSGWKTGEAWGTEVLLPAGFDYGQASNDTQRAQTDWQGLGLTVPSSGAAPSQDSWPADFPASNLLLPAGMHGPAFLVTDNFAAILRYNNATMYALAVGHLADRLAGRPPLAALWPADDPPLDRSGRLELQQRLAALGYDVGTPDGLIGNMTRNAIRAWQRKQRLPEDGWPGTRLLDLLRTEPGVTR